MRKRRINILLVLILALAFSAAPTVPSARAFQIQNSLELAAWPEYLGPQVVLAGHVSSAAGIPVVTVTVQDVTSAGPPIFSGVAPTALRPPLGDPAASWRVPLTLSDGIYKITVVSSIGGETLQQESAEFEVVSETILPVNLIPLGAQWAYYDQGDAPVPSGAINWYEPGYAAAGWLRGPAELGYGDDDEATLTQEFIAGDNKVIAQYFRHEFVGGNLADFDTVTMSLLRDDGAVVYLNGVELGRTNMPEGPVGYDTFARSVNEQTISISFDAADLLSDTNLLAVEVHQSSENSSDISFSATLDAIQSDAPKVSDNTEGTFVLTAGDMARCNFDGDEAVADQMAELFDTDRGVFIGLGDLVYNSGTIDEFTACYDPTIGQFRDVTWPAPGNHEHNTTPNAAGYRQYFGPAAGPTAGPNGGLWYSFDIDDNWHVIALDSDCADSEPLPGAIDGDGCAVGSEQEQWLRADLDTNQDKNILAFFHHPSFTNNQYTDHERTWPLWRALSEYGTEIVLNGHEHHYERYVPLDYWGEPAATNSITEFIIGSGGTHPRYDVRPQEAESAFRGTFPDGTNDFGVLQLWLRPDGYEWKWESIYGLAATDQGTAGLNEPMERGVIGGQVTNGSTADPLADLDVCAIAQRTQLRSCTTTDAQGRYSLAQPVVLDDYEITTIDPAGKFPPPAPTVVGLQPGQNPIDITMGTRPAVADDAAPEPRGGEISGVVTDADTGAPLHGISVCADSFGLTEPRCVATNPAGVFAIDDLAAGNYIVRYEDPTARFMAECYENGSCDQPAAVGVIESSVRAGINATLDRGPATVGDADCSGTFSVDDALIIAQFAVGARHEAPCLLTDGATQIAAGAADTNGDGTASVVDALIVAQCAAGRNNVLCP